MNSLNVILAFDFCYGIGKNNSIPWHNNSLYKQDMIHFKTLTLDKTIIMGHETWLSLPKPLTRRKNVIVTRNHYDYLLFKFKNEENIKVYDSLDEAIRMELKLNDVFVIGGASLYNSMFENIHPTLCKVYVTKIKSTFDCDTFVDETIYNNFMKNNNLTVRTLFKTSDIDIDEYSVNHSSDCSYLTLVNKILYTGLRMKTRNAETISLFGEHLEFDLEKGFPLLTTKKMFWKGIVEELLWFIRGDTNVHHLQEKGIHIWDGNSSREFLDSVGLKHLDEGDAGAIYSHQWRHFNAPYITCETDYSGKGIDQLSDVISLIRNDPTSRRILMTSWNPCQSKDMSLLPCHVSYQFYVDVEEGKLMCMMYQRSADVFLGLPFNIASTALLTTILAKHCGLIASRIIISLGNVHIYNEHIDAIMKQLHRRPLGFPTLTIWQKHLNIEEYTIDDIELHNYFSHPTIHAKMIP